MSGSEDDLTIRVVHIGLNDKLLTVYFLKMDECREVLGGGPAPPSKL